MELPKLVNVCVLREVGIELRDEKPVVVKYGEQVVVFSVLSLQRRYGAVGTQFLFTATSLW